MQDNLQSGARSQRPDAAEEGQQASRKPYAAPQLLSYGSVAAVTGSNMAASFFDDMNNSNTANPPMEMMM